MAKKMLIDATHAEETRVAVLDGNRLVDFDYESKFRKPLKGNIFLAKVTRVEPSLQAAFVNFGGNRHGFLPFTEIHPDYFRIPIADREALIAEELAELEARKKHHDEEHDLADIEHDEDHSADVEEIDDGEHEVEEIGGDLADEKIVEAENSVVEGVALDESDLEQDKKSEKKTKNNKGKSKKKETEVLLEQDTEEKPEKETDSNETAEANETVDEESSDKEPVEDEEDGNKKSSKRRYPRRNYRGKKSSKSRRYSSARSRRVERVGGEEIEQPYRPNIRRKYKIQEVVKRGQIMLIQASKEERGNKGAAVTTYLSLPGRYSVLMPNSPRGGGVSRKIANVKERKRMREILEELAVPEGMSVIMRTAGVSRTKSEIKRDLDYLMRIWNKIRELTLNSTAPALVYEEGSLLKRSIRDIYTRDVDEILVAGEDGYKSAKDFMKMLIPSHAKKVKHYKDEKFPLYQRYQAESQISEIGEPTASLKSGGYLVINPTEALVSIDVNSGRATKERHIEETALNTNLEAADEVARQLRLRDLGGLVVIDFIDMEDYRNNRKVERRLKEALSTDRARIQIGRISSFGLMELSRQRLNPSLTEAQFETCPHCKGLGYRRTIDSVAIMALRALEEEGCRERSEKIGLVLSNDVALFILNSKREILADIEQRYNVSVHIRVEKDIPLSDFRVEPLKVKSSKEDQDEEKEEADSSSDQKNKKRTSKSNQQKRNRKAPRNRKPRDQYDQDSDDDQNSLESVQDNSSFDHEEHKDKKPSKKQNARGRSRKNVSKEDKKNEQTSSVKEENADTDIKKQKEEADKKKTSRKTSNAKRGRTKKTDDQIESGKEKEATVKENKDKAEVKAKSSVKTVSQIKARSSVENEKKDSKEFEVVNKEPEQKKKGWWGRLVE